MVSHPSTACRLSRERASAATVVGCTGTGRLLRNFVVRTTKPSAVTSSRTKRLASEIRSPVAAKSPKRVEE